MVPRVLRFCARQLLTRVLVIMFVINVAAANSKVRLYIDTYFLFTRTRARAHIHIYTHAHTHTHTYTHTHTHIYIYIYIYAD